MHFGEAGSTEDPNAEIAEEDSDESENQHASVEKESDESETGERRTRIDSAHAPIGKPSFLKRIANWLNV